MNRPEIGSRVRLLGVDEPRRVIGACELEEVLERDPKTGEPSQVRAVAGLVVQLDGEATGRYPESAVLDVLPAGESPA